MNYRDTLLQVAGVLGKSSGGGGEPPVLVTKLIDINGNYSAVADGADGYSEVEVNVINTYGLDDEGKVVNNGSLVAQTSDTATSNGTVDTTLINSLTVNVPGSGDTNVFQYLEFTPVTDATSTNKLSVQTDVVPSGTPWILVCAPKTNPPIPPSNEYSALVYVAGKYINQSVSSILRSDGTVGGDSGMAQYNVSTGVLKVGGSWGTYRAGQTYCVWLLTIEV